MKEQKKTTTNANVNPIGGPDLPGGCLRQRNGITITSLNIKNAKCKHHFKKISESTDILLLQEHCLYNDYLMSLVGALKSNVLTMITLLLLPNIPLVMLALWSPSKDSCIEKIEDGGHRINAIVIKASLKPLCVVNVFMPSRGYTEADTRYLEILDQLHKILTKYWV